MNATASKLTAILARSASVCTTGTNRRFTYSFHTWNVVTRKS